LDLNDKKLIAFSKEEPEEEKKQIQQTEIIFRWLPCAVPPSIKNRARKCWPAKNSQSAATVFPIENSC
jgi:hypothetical protein